VKGDYAGDDRRKGIFRRRGRGRPSHREGKARKREEDLAGSRSTVQTGPLEARKGAKEEGERKRPRKAPVVQEE